MKLTKISKKNNTLAFAIEGASTAFVNTLRRTIVNEVPTMAIEEVEFRKNTSTLYDEMIALRLGLLVLTTDLKSYEFPSENVPKDSAKASLKLTLNAKGPKTVYASDIKSADPSVKPVHGKTPIVKLLEGQELEFEATAVLGRGKTHAKWSPGHAYYRNDATITINNSSQFLDEYKTLYPAEIFKDGKIEKSLIEKNNLVDAVDGVNEDIIKVEYNPDKFIFVVEAWGQLSPEEMVEQAMDHLASTADDFVAALKELK
ncbi:MAG: DNA-directed RNA polymerase subunit D [Nanoarchaeota archaeon]